MLATFGVALAGSLCCGAQTSTAAGMPAGGPVQIFATPNLAPNSPAGTIVITGAIGDYGTTLTMDQNGKADPNGHLVKVTLKKGTFEIDSTKLDAIANKVQPTFTMATCSGSGSAVGPVTLFEGTGRYAGIKGTVKITETFAFVGPTYASGAKKGQCNMSNAAQPIAQYGSITGTGTVTFS